MGRMTTSKPSPAQTITKTSQLTVLVVDDEESIRTLLSVMLELEGYRVLQAENGVQALATAATEHLDLITLDVMMPGLDGWQVAAALDEDDRLCAVPRVMVSGMPLAQLLGEPGARRASAVLAKPFDFVEFIEIVQELLAKPLPVPEPRNGEALAG
ncbi:MAG: diguanylate cyclase [Frankiales bacterium]|nr:diguanylate cyclase [Frankiales bacterium]